MEGKKVGGVIESFFSQGKPFSESLKIGEGLTKSLPETLNKAVAALYIVKGCYNV